MSEKFVGLAAALLSIAISGGVLAEKRVEKRVDEMNLEERRAYFKPEPLRVQSCPLGDDNFWHHWATQQGYEQLFHGNIKQAAACYEKAGKMYRKNIADPSGDCFVCDSYERMGAILRQLPTGTIDIRKETFEESAKKANRQGDKRTAAKLFELTAIGYADLEIEGNYGRFCRDYLHADRYNSP